MAALGFFSFSVSYCSCMYERDRDTKSRNGRETRVGEAMASTRNGAMLPVCAPSSGLLKESLPSGAQLGEKMGYAVSVRVAN